MRQKPKFEDGSLTRMAGEEIEKLEEYISEEGLPERKYFEELEPGALFREGIDGWLCKLGYDSSMDDPKKKVAFLQAQFEKNGVAPVSNATLTNWLTRVDKNGKPAAPSTNQQNRENIFRLCFALEMDGADTAVFLLKSCLCRPFNYKNTDEAVYFYCLSKGLRYGDARRIITRVEEAQKSVPEGNVCTEQIGQELEIMRDEDDLVEYLTTHTYTKEKWHYSARNEIKDLLKSCKELARYDTGNDFVDVGLEEASEKKSAVRGNDSLLNTIYGFRASVRKGDDGLSAKNDYDFPEFLRDNWISKQSLYNVMNGKNVSDEVYRKALIILSFYNFYAALYKEKGLWAHYAEFDADEKFEKCSCANEFEAELDERLESCGYSQLYKRNPFDWFILHCAAFPNPLRYFRETLADYYRE